MLCKSLIYFALPRVPPSSAIYSYILIIVSRSQQRFELDRVGFGVVFEVSPEEIDPVAMNGFDHAEEAALEEFDDVFAPTTVEGGFAAFSDEVTVPKIIFRSGLVVEGKVYVSKALELKNVN